MIFSSMSELLSGAAKERFGLIKERKTGNE